jgi:hypothetical protein
VDNSKAPSPPKDQFEPYVPSDDSPWDTPKAGHLLRRLTFGPTRQRLDAMLKMSPGDAVDSLLDYDPEKDPFEGMLEQMEGLFNLRDVGQVQQWWIYRMVFSPQPAQEKIVLFWHNYFATSGAKVDGLYMHKQIELFRAKGTGSFRDLLIAVATDPAMLIWLDGKDNRKGKPNENFAREVMELFTLGVGNYTEDDIKQLARAFTGWRIENNAGVFKPEQFDKGEKTIFSEKGDYDLEGAIDLILKRPIASKHLARKLLRGFVNPFPTDEQIEHYAKRLVENDWNLRKVMHEMFTSRMFFSDWAYRSKIKSPIELAIGGTLVFGGKANMPFLRESTTKMGQTILQPPNVKGWDGEEAWINSNTVLLRFNYGLQLATQRGDEYAKRSPIEKELYKRNLLSAEQIIDHFANLLLDGRLQPKFREDMIKYMALVEPNKFAEFKLKDEKFNDKVRGLLHLMMTTPEYQLA